MEDELGLACQLIAGGVGTADKQIAGGEDLGYSHSATCAGLHTKHFLSGDVGGDLFSAINDVIFA